MRWAMVGLLLSAGCSDSDRAGRISPGMEPNDASVAGDSMLTDVVGPDGPPSPDAGGLCGNQFFQAAPEPPNLYFVLDRSGSMKEPSGLHGWDKYTAVRVAAVNVVRALGSRANFGAAVFPGEPSLLGDCATGGEVFSTRRGDAPGGTSDGPVTLKFSHAIDVDPVGGTPTAATLEALLPTLSALKGKTAVVLSTDGAPNCRWGEECTASECIFNIEGDSVGDKKCEGGFNCCDPNLPGGPGLAWCVDAVYTTQAIQKLRDQGIRTFVVGIPGSSFYDALLDQMAIVGGSARPASPRYYRVDDMEALSDTLQQIGNQVLLSCELVLDGAPPDPAFVNVYFDQKVVAYDEENGWTWTGSNTLSLHGDACEALEQGAVGQVQVVAGCPTEQPL